MTAKGKKRMIAWMIVAVLAVGLAALAVWTAWGNTALELNTYTVQSDRLPVAFNNYRIAQVSDLHNDEMGEGNEKLLSVLRNASPDIIVITGDLIDSRRTNIDVALHFATEAMKIAPCYYVTGNHEARISAYDRLREGLTETGVVVLEDEKVYIQKDGESIAVLGVADPSFCADFMASEAETVGRGLDGLVEENRYTVLLSHRPELFEVYRDKGLDLVFSGHAHGGQFRLPFVGGLAAPDQGLFPKYDAGLYKEGNTNMIVSRGIGNSLFPFRFNNRPEVVLTELQSK